MLTSNLGYLAGRMVVSSRASPGPLVEFRSVMEEWEKGGTGSVLVIHRNGGRPFFL